MKFFYILLENNKKLQQWNLWKFNVHHQLQVLAKYTNEIFRKKYYEYIWAIESKTAFNVNCNIERKFPEIKESFLLNDCIGEFSCDSCGPSHVPQPVIATEVVSNICCTRILANRLELSPRPTIERLNSDTYMLRNRYILLTWVNLLYTYKHCRNRKVLLGEILANIYTTNKLPKYRQILIVKGVFV